VIGLRRVLIGSVIVAIVGVGCQAAAPSSPDVPTAPIDSSAPAEAAAAPTLVGPTVGSEQVHFTVSLNLRDDGELADFLVRLNDPDSPDYHRYLTPSEFGERFGLDAGAVDDVVAWLQSAGLAASVVPQRTSIAASGRAADVNRLLGITLEDWTTPGGDPYHQPSGEPSVPSAVRDEVAAILGLDTEPVLEPAFGGILASGVPAGGLLPRTVARAYEIEPLQEAGMHGEGQVVAIVSFDTFTPSDVGLFDAREGFDAPPIETVRIPGAVQDPGPGTGEVALDIQVIRGIAPQTRIINYEGPNTADGFAALISRIVADGQTQIVSISWGLCEKYTVPSALRAEEREFAAAFAAGISVFVASGDDGAFGCRRVAISDDPFDRDLSQDAQWPSTSPSTIAVGGTFLSVLEDGTYLSEAGWEEPLSGAGGGGGLSTFMDRPTWQVGEGVNNSDSNGSRQVPDVAGPADPASGFFIVYTEPGQGLVNGQVGGTSAAAPFWAGSMALTRQLAGTQGVDALGALGPTLYQISGEQPAGAVFHDVIRGGNLLFEAGPGWDYSTGLGSPRVAPLAQAIIDFLNR
jgi:kumamolisin